MSRDFNTLLHAQWDAGKFLCVGLDTDFDALPESARVAGVRESLVNFNRSIIDATKDVAGSYKINSAFYEAYGDLGFFALQETIQHIRTVASDTPVILDAKRGDIGNTNAGYVAAAFERLVADAITVHPYLGSESLAPFLENTECGVFVLCRTSNPGAGEFQDLDVGGDPSRPGSAEAEPLYLRVARNVAHSWNTHGNCGLVVGATYPDEMARIRAVADDVPFLIPGIGAQGGDLEKAVRSGKDSRARGILIAISRGILGASKGSDYAEAARAKAQEYDAAIRSAL